MLFALWVLATPIVDGYLLHKWATVKQVEKEDERIRRETEARRMGQERMQEERRRNA